MSFGNPIVGGTTLVRPAIKSPNYIVNTAGWTINADGTAEFNQVVVRGEVRVTAPSGAFVDIVADSTNAFVDINPPDLTGHTITQASLYGSSNASFASLTIDGPEVDGGNKVQMELIGLTAGKSELDMHADTILMNAADFISITGGPVIDFSNATSTALSDTTIDSDLTNVDGNFYLRGKRGTTTVVVTGPTANFNQAVVFSPAFSVGVTPLVFCNMTNGPAGWRAVGLSPSNTGFIINLNTAGAAGAFSGNVQWIAVVPTN